MDLGLFLSASDVKVFNGGGGGGTVFQARELSAVRIYNSLYCFLIDKSRYTKPRKNSLSQSTLSKVRATVLASDPNKIFSHK